MWRKCFVSNTSVRMSRIWLGVRLVIDNSFQLAIKSWKTSFFWQVNSLEPGRSLWYVPNKAKWIMHHYPIGSLCCPEHRSPILGLKTANVFTSHEPVRHWSKGLLLKQLCKAYKDRETIWIEYLVRLYYIYIYIWLWGCHTETLPDFPFCMLWLFVVFN